MGEKYYVVFTVNGQFGSAEIKNRPMDTWEEILVVRRMLMEQSKSTHIDQVQIINWKRID